MLNSQLKLFDDAGNLDLSKVPAARTKPRGSMNWTVADHACRHCFGRVLQRVVRGVSVEVRCANCGARADGDVSSLCCCGADCGALGNALECFKNPNITKEVPHEIMVRERPVARVAAPARISRPVRTRGD